ncbi:MAG: patatin-like phospholipase family protein [Pseudorhodoplanes sp.]
MRRRETRGFGAAAAVILAGLLALWGVTDATSSVSPVRDDSAITSQSKKKKAAKTPAKNAPAAKSAKPEGPPPRTPFVAADQELAAIANIPNARFWADSEAEYMRALPTQRGPWLILSAGGEDGAYGAGLLGGWSKAGKRPEFAMVTGVSTGALIAPFAFLGPKYDEALRDAYTKISAVDIFEVGGKGESLLDTWPLHDLIAKRTTPELLKAIAAEHARGRRLLIVTTNLDAGRPVAWDIGAIATRGDEDALKLVRNVLVAAVSIPGAFPPVLIDVDVNGRRIQEMHADGGTIGQFYLAPDSMLVSTSNEKLAATDIYLVANMKLGQDFALTERSLVGILNRTVTTAIKYMLRNAIDRAYALAKRSGAGFYLAYVPQDFSAPARGPFDPDYMRPLYEAGYAKGASQSPFFREPPDLSVPPGKAAR